LGDKIRFWGVKKIPGVRKEIFSTKNQKPKQSKPFYVFKTHEAQI
jgi:hypothetical protein